VPDLEHQLRNRVAGGGKLFLPYVTGGLPGVDEALLRELERSGADAVEVGVPFSDPVMDGPVIQEASQRALEKGASPAAVLDLVARAGLSIPVVVMTYLNPVLAPGPERFLDAARESGVAGVIVPDLPVDEGAEWREACSSRDIASVFLAAPGSSRKRLRQVAAATRGFVYCVAAYGVTGERASLGSTAREVVDGLRPLTSIPLVVGVGIGTPAAANAACQFADGVVVGSALVRPLLDGDPGRTVQLGKEFRAAIS
jgi:tryptophan synthase alpha chain